MPQAASPVSASDPSVEQVAGAINAMIAERATERLHKAPAAEPLTGPTKPRQPGVYFGLPSAHYHADPSVGSSDLKRLLQAPTVYWWHSHMNPDRPPSPDSLAKQKGRALHKLVLEGEEAFGKSFAEEPSPAGYPGCLATLDDLKAKCRELGEPVSGTKAELAKRIKARDSHIIIFVEVLATFRVMAERDGLARAFQGGIPEVSVFWLDEYGIPCKARLDWLKPRTIVDLKKCANQRERPFDVAVLLAIAEYRYDISARHYLDGYAYLYQFAAEGRVFGDCQLKPGWHKRIMSPGDTKEHYRTCLAKFGTHQWVSDAPITALDDRNLPSWLREDVEEYA